MIDTINKADEMVKQPKGAEEKSINKQLWLKKKDYIHPCDQIGR